MPIRHRRGGQPNSSAGPLPTGFWRADFPLPAGSAKRAQSIDIARSFGVERAIFEG
jgi:hypothetical protein